MPRPPAPPPLAQIPPPNAPFNIPPQVIPPIRIPPPAPVQQQAQVQMPRPPAQPPLPPPALQIPFGQWGPQPPQIQIPPPPPPPPQMQPPPQPIVQPVQPVAVGPPPVVAPVMVPFPDMRMGGRNLDAEPIKLEDPNAPGPFARLPGVPPPLVVFPGSVPLAQG